MITLGLDLPIIHPRARNTSTGGWVVVAKAETADPDIRVFGELVFPPFRAERLLYRELGVTLDQLQERHRFQLLVCEVPYIRRLTELVGALKLWTARKRGVTWYTIAPSSAQKEWFGKARQSKEEVHRAMCKLSGRPTLTFHQADALLYALTGTRRWWAQSKPLPLE